MRFDLLQNCNNSIQLIRNFVLFTKHLQTNSLQYLRVWNFNPSKDVIIDEGSRLIHTTQYVFSHGSFVKSYINMLWNALIYWLN